MKFFLSYDGDTSIKFQPQPQDAVHEPLSRSFLMLTLTFVPSQMFEFYERVSGARMHAAYVRPGGVHQVGELTE